MAEEKKPKMSEDEAKQMYDKFIEAQVKDYQKRHPNAHKEAVPDNIKRGIMNTMEKLEKYKNSEKFKSLTAKYREKFKKLYDEHGVDAYKNTK